MGAPASVPVRGCDSVVAAQPDLLRSAKVHAVLDVIDARVSGGYRACVSRWRELLAAEDAYLLAEETLSFTEQGAMMRTVSPLGCLVPESIRLMVIAQTAVVCAKGRPSC